MEQIRILIVDDSGVMRKITKTHLAKIGYQNVVEASPLTGQRHWRNFPRRKSIL